MSTPPQEGDSSDWFDIAAKWAELPAEQFKTTVNFVNRQAQRDHEYRMEVTKLSHRLYLVGLCFGFVISGAMLGGAIIVGDDSPWLAALLLGPSLLALVSVFVLRKLDARTVHGVGQVSRDMLGAAPPRTDGVP